MQDLIDCAVRHFPTLFVVGDAGNVADRRVLVSSSSFCSFSGSCSSAVVFKLLKLVSQILTNALNSSYDLRLALTLSFSSTLGSGSPAVLLARPACPATSAPGATSCRNSDLNSSGFVGDPDVPVMKISGSALAASGTSARLSSFLPGSREASPLWTRNLRPPELPSIICPLRRSASRPSSSLSLPPPVPAVLLVLDAAAAAAATSFPALPSITMLPMLSPQSSRTMAPSVGSSRRPSDAALINSFIASTCFSVMLPCSWMPCSANGCFFSDEFGSEHHTTGTADMMLLLFNMVY
uniref:Uncharacterized protein n=1 Tax=Anopheles culicifacies TaxID=139723 RepID=A0A182MGZ9_9DIPT